METKYFERQTKFLKSTPWKEIELNRKNMWYVQLDASIRYAFIDRGVSFPKAVYVEDVNYNGYIVTYIRIVRANLITHEDVMRWVENKIYIMDDLKHQAECNSSDNHQYIFEII